MFLFEICFNHYQGFKTEKGIQPEETGKEKIQKLNRNRNREEENPGRNRNKEVNPENVKIYKQNQKKHGNNILRFVLFCFRFVYALFLFGILPFDSVFFLPAIKKPAAF